MVGSLLTCTAKVVESGRTVIFVMGEIRDERDRLIATGSSTYIVSERSD